MRATLRHHHPFSAEMPEDKLPSVTGNSGGGHSRNFGIREAENGIKVVQHGTEAGAEDDAPFGVEVTDSLG